MNTASALRLPDEVAEPLGRPWSQEEAFRYCADLTRRHYENFPVGSWLVPPSLRPAVHSLYAFMRTADDFADEKRTLGDESERLAYLASWESLLEDCEQGEARHPVFVALRVTLNQHPLPVQWLRDLLTAFKMDVTVRRYAAYADVLNYCRYSANPVGRLILSLFEYRDEELYRLSDCICTALQLANHWQDVAIDLQKDRIYLPQEDLRRFGVQKEWMFAQANVIPAKAKSPLTPPFAKGGAGGFGSPLTSRGDDDWENFRRLMAFQVRRTRELFESGKSLPERVRGRLRWELRLTWRGGSSILDKIEQARCDVFRQRPTVTRTDWLRLFFLSLLGKRK